MDLAKGIRRTALAFRGYNVTNLGRTPELMAVPAYRDILQPYLESASRTCQEITGKPVDLVARVAAQKDTTLEDYAESIALIVSVEQAQLAINAFPDLYQIAYQTGFNAKLGLVGLQEGDADLGNDLLKVMAEQKVDFTLVQNCLVE